MATEPQRAFVPTEEELSAAIKQLDYSKQARVDCEQKVADAKRRGAEIVATVQAAFAADHAAWKKECEETAVRHAAIRVMYDAIAAAAEAVETAEDEVHAAMMAEIYAWDHEKCAAQANLVAAHAKLVAAQEALCMARNKETEPCFQCDCLCRAKEARKVRSLHEA
jgi:hypothetical protein